MSKCTIHTQYWLIICTSIHFTHICKISVRLYLWALLFRRGHYQNFHQISESYRIPPCISQAVLFRGQWLVGLPRSCHHINYLEANFSIYLRRSGRRILPRDRFSAIQAQPKVHTHGQNRSPCCFVPVVGIVCTARFLSSSESVTEYESAENFLAFLMHVPVALFV